MKNKIANKSKVKHVCVIILTVVSIFLIASCVKAISIYSDGFNANWNTVVNHIELLCSNEDASFAGHTYHFETNGGLHTDKNGQAAWILSTQGDPQAAWWHLVDPPHPNTTLNDNAKAYAKYRSNFDGIKVSNLTLNNDKSASFDLDGTGYNTMFVKEIKLTIYGKKYNGKDFKDENFTGTTISKKYIDNNDLAKIKIKVTGKHIVANSKWQNYKATKIKTNKGWEDITSGAQPLTVFEGSREWINDSSETSWLWVRTKVSIDKYITQIKLIKMWIIIILLEKINHKKIKKIIKL